MVNLQPGFRYLANSLDWLRQFLPFANGAAFEVAGAESRSLGFGVRARVGYHAGAGQDGREVERNHGDSGVVGSQPKVSQPPHPTALPRPHSPD